MATVRGLVEWCMVECMMEMEVLGTCGEVRLRVLVC